MSLRLPEELAIALSAVARADEMTIAAFVREAIEKHITSRLADPAFQERMEKRLAKDRESLERLAR
jgi:predicted DNA-binding protein